MNTTDYDAEAYFLIFLVISSAWWIIYGLHVSDNLVVSIAVVVIIVGCLIAFRKLSIWYDRRYGEWGEA